MNKAKYVLLLGPNWMQVFHLRSEFKNLDPQTTNMYDYLMVDTHRWGSIHIRCGESESSYNNITFFGTYLVDWA